MLRRYELTDEEWLRIEPLLPPENTGKQGQRSFSSEGHAEEIL